MVVEEKLRRRCTSHSEKCVRQVLTLLFLLLAVSFEVIPELLSRCMASTVHLAHTQTQPSSSSGEKANPAASGKLEQAGAPQNQHICAVGSPAAVVSHCCGTAGAWTMAGTWTAGQTVEATVPFPLGLVATSNSALSFCLPAHVSYKCGVVISATEDQAVVQFKVVREQQGRLLARHCWYPPVQA